MMKKDANRRGKGWTRAEQLPLLLLADVYFNISSDRETQRMLLLKPHKTKRQRGAKGSEGRGAQRLHKEQIILGCWGIQPRIHLI